MNILKPPLQKASGEAGMFIHWLYLGVSELLRVLGQGESATAATKALFGIPKVTETPSTEDLHISHLLIYMTCSSQTLTVRVQK